MVFPGDVQALTGHSIPLGRVCRSLLGESGSRRSGLRFSPRSAGFLPAQVGTIGFPSAAAVALGIARHNGIADGTGLAV